MTNNICKFMPKSQNTEEINILNFVYETEHIFSSAVKCDNVNKMHLVTQGTGTICLQGKRYSLQAGDLFLLFRQHLTL